MKYLLKVAEHQLKPGSQKEMYYIDDKGELFVGPVKNVTSGKTFRVEATPKRFGGTYHRITSWLD